MDRQLELAILSGGQNYRFGGYSKAFTKIKGEPIYQRIMNAAGMEKALIIANSAEDKEHFSRAPNLKVFSDIIKGKGPLSGVHAAITQTTSNYILLMPSDLPLMNKKTINFLKNNFNPSYDAIIPVSEETIIHPISAIYAKRIKPVLEKFLHNSEKTSVHNFLSYINPLYINMPGDNIFQQAFMNMNTPEDYQTLLKILNNEDQ